MAQGDINYLIESWSSGKIDVKVKGGKPIKIQIALLRIAYLLAFEKFGYGYIMNASLNQVREQILQPSKVLMDNFGIVNVNISDDHEGIFLVAEPKDMFGILVAYNLIHGAHKTKAFVILPLPNSSNLYASLQKRYTGENLNIKLSKIMNLPFLTDTSLTRITQKLK